MRFVPAYLGLHEKGELNRRAARGLEMLRSCRVCPRDCDVDRLLDQKAFCLTGRYAVVASYFPHFGEDCLRSHRGSGTIFFANCKPEVRLLPELRHQAPGCARGNALTWAHDS